MKLTPYCGPSEEEVRPDEAALPQASKKTVGDSGRALFTEAPRRRVFSGGMGREAVDCRAAAVRTRVALVNALPEAARAWQR